MNGSGLYNMDGLDLFDTYGYVVETGSDGLMEDAGLKDPPSYNWEDQNGVEYFLDERFSNDKTVTFTGHIVAATKLEYWRKYIALLEALKAPGERTIFSHELEQSFQTFFKKTENTKRFTRLQGYPDLVAVKMDLVFQIISNEFVEPGGKLNQTITFPSLPVKLLGDSDFSPVAASSSGLPITLTSSNPAVATIVDNYIHIVGAGKTTITATQTGDASYNAAIQKTQILTVSAVNNAFTYTFPYYLS